MSPASFRHRLHVRVQHVEIGTPFGGSNPRELRACARAVDAGITRTDVALDGRPVPVNEVESGLLRLNLPADNIFGAPAGTGPLSVAHGWVAHLGRPLAPGTHTITLHIEGTYLGAPVDFSNLTTIIDPAPRLGEKPPRGILKLRGLGGAGGTSRRECPVSAVGWAAAPLPHLSAPARGVGESL